MSELKVTTIDSNNILYANVITSGAASMKKNFSKKQK